MEKLRPITDAVRRFARSWQKAPPAGAPRWRPEPIVYEINTRVWLNSLSQQVGRRITLANVPDAALDELASYRVDAIWLMGVWTRSRAVRESALNYMHEYQPVLPDLTPEDVIGSGYAIGKYVVDPACGGRDGLAAIRQRLAARGMKLILDYVPNHVAVDHPAIATHPEYFVRGDAHTPGDFFTTKDAHGRELRIAHGRDPYFPGWIDTAQLNAFHPALRQATREVLLDIASQCDGVRCDMAMLMTNDVFQQTWGWLVKEPRPHTEFWHEVIPAVRQRYPDFLFIAEVYWNMDYALQQQGFDYTYDKDLYDRLFAADIAAIRTHLTADLRYMRHTMRFIENHDEPRAAAAFGVPKSRALAVLICTLPGAVLLHDGQFVGRTRKLPVQIGRQPSDEIEPPNHDLKAFYLALLAAVDEPIYRGGDWWLFEVEHNAALAYAYRQGDERRVIVVNPHDAPVEATIRLRGWLDSDADLRLSLAFGEGQARYRDGVLTVALPPYTGTIFNAQAVRVTASARQTSDLHA